jgi:glutaredoxin
MIKHLKTLGMYALILVAGLGVGVAVAKAPALFKKDFVQGDYSAYLAQHRSQVVLYGTDTCPFCAKARAYFKDKGIAYADLDVGKPGQARDEFKKLGGNGVPLLLKASMLPRSMLHCRLRRARLAPAINLLPC